MPSSSPTWNSGPAPPIRPFPKRPTLTTTELNIGLGSPMVVAAHAQVSGGYDRYDVVGQDRYLQLRRHDQCATCRTELDAGTRAWWDPTRKSVTCLRCRPERKSSAAGGSAQAKYEIEKAKYEQNTRAAHPHIGGLLLKVREEPQAVQAWSKGAAGERRLGAALSALASESNRIEVIHDRRIPGSRANIDHIAITPAGVYVIDAKWYVGRIETRDRGGFFRSDVRLFVNGRDRTTLIDGMMGQVAAVHDVVGSVAPIVPVLCFIDADIGFFARPFTLRGVRVTWFKPLRKQLRADGPLLPEGVADLTLRLEHGLRPAV